MTDDVTIKVGVDGTNTSVKDLKKTQKSVKNLGDETDKLSSKAEKAKSLWKKFAVGVSAVGVAAIAATKKFANFEKSMQGIVTIIGDRTVQNVERLKNGILDLGAKGFGSFENINQAIYDFISATGSSVPEALKFMRDASDAAAIGITDISTTTDIATTAIEVYGKEVDNIQDVFKSYYVAVREGKTTFDEIAASQGRVAATSKALGVQMEEELAVFAASTKAGIAQSEVVSALKAAYSNILKPTKEAQEAATDLGLKFDAQALKTKKLIPFLTELAQKTEGNAQAQSALFGSMEAFTVISALTANNAEELNRIFAAMGDEAQVAEDYIDGVKRTTENTDRAFKIITNTFNKWVTLIGEEFSPAIKLVADAMQALDEAFTGNKVNIQELVKEQKEAIIIRDSLQKKLDEEQEKLDTNSATWEWYTEKLVGSLQRQIEEKQLQVDTLAEQIAQEQELLAEQDEANKERKLANDEEDNTRIATDNATKETQLQTHVENKQSIEDQAKALEKQAYQKELQARLKLDDEHYKTLITDQQKYNAYKNKLILEDAAKEGKRKAAERMQFLKLEDEYGTTYAKMNKFFQDDRVNIGLQTAQKLAAISHSENSAFSEIAKAANAIQIGMSTYKAAMDAYAALASIPVVGPALGATAAAAAVAYGGQQLQNMYSSANKSIPQPQIRGANEGGIVTSGIVGQDTEPFLLSKNEMVVPADVTPTLLAMFDTLRSMQGNNNNLALPQPDDELEPQEVIVTLDTSDEFASNFDAQAQSNARANI